MDATRVLPDSSGSGDGHTWVVSIQCGNGGICVEHVECTEGGQEGYVHDVYMDGTDVGDVCVPQDAVQQVDLAKLIIRQFKRIAWPSSKLVVQPRGGRTLVNFETNFYTPDHRSIDQSVTVAGQSVVIRAVPVSYTYCSATATARRPPAPAARTPTSRSPTRTRGPATSSYGWTRRMPVSTASGRGSGRRSRTP